MKKIFSLLSLSLLLNACSSEHRTSSEETSFIRQEAAWLLVDQEELNSVSCKLLSKNEEHLEVICERPLNLEALVEQRDVVEAYHDDLVVMGATQVLAQIDKDDLHKVIPVVLEKVDALENAIESVEKNEALLKQEKKDFLREFRALANKKIVHDCSAHRNNDKEIISFSCSEEAKKERKEDILKQIELILSLHEKLNQTVQEVHKSIQVTSSYGAEENLKTMNYVAMLKELEADVKKIVRPAV